MTNPPRSFWTGSGPKESSEEKPRQEIKEEEDSRMNTAPIVSRVWSFCTTLRDDGVSYGDYLEQLTYLIFLKMADEYAKPPYNRDVGIPVEFNWQNLKSKKGADLEGHYVTLLRELGSKAGMLGQIFTKSQNKIQDPAKAVPSHRHGGRHRMGHHGCRRKGGHLRRTSREERRRYQVGRGPVFHAARPYPRYGRMRTARTRHPHRRPGLWNRRFLSGFLRLHHQPGQLQSR